MSNNHYLRTPISNLISRNKFLIIWRFLHCNNKNSSDSSDKIKNIINYLNNQSQNIYNPSKKLALDETISKFRGKSKYLQYNPMKPTKLGIKLFS